MPPTNEPDGNGSAGTGEKNSSATQTPQNPPAVTPDTFQPPEGFELIRTEDKKNLVSQRDRANNGNSESDALLGALYQKDAIRDTVSNPKFKEDYPDVTMEDLLDANPSSDEEILAVAKLKQERFETIRQNALKNVQRVDGPPTISPEEKAEELKKLAGPQRPKNAFARALKIDLMKVINK